jgi:hypothetical protein
MEKKGLCCTCLHFETCIFNKKPPVWHCEEFYSNSSVPVRCTQAKIKKVVSREVATESE